MTPKKIKLYIDLAMYIVLIPFITLFVPAQRVIESSSKFMIVLSLFVYLVYYINSNFSIIGALSRKQYLRAASIIAVLLALTFITVNLPIEIFGLNITDNDRVDYNIRARVVWYIFAMLMAIGFTLSLLYELHRQSSSKQEAELEKRRAEIALYKAQINPHFMFNTLNTIYGLIISKSDSAEGVFVKFTDILKYMYTNADADTIAIHKEVKYISDYIELQRARLTKRTKVIFQHSIEDENYTIAPMILITFLENCFKYGVSSTIDTTIEIDITLKGGKCSFSTVNDITKEGTQKGIGIENCRKRLELLYDGRYTLDTYKDGSKYYVKLTINN